MPIYRLGEHTPQMQEGVWIADTATVIGDVHLGRNVNLWFGAILRGDNDPITIGDDTNIQDGSVLHTDEGVPLTIAPTSPSATKPCCTAARWAKAR